MARNTIFCSLDSEFSSLKKQLTSHVKHVPLSACAVGVGEALAMIDVTEAGTSSTKVSKSNLIRQIKELAGHILYRQLLGGFEVDSISM